MPLHLIDHPVAHHALLELRDTRTLAPAFRRAAFRVTLVLATEALRTLPTEPALVATPLGPAEGRRMAAGITVVPVLRAGLGMLDAVLSLAPDASVGHIGLQRDEATAMAARYYARLPEGLDGAAVLLLDPMLATGGSAVAALDLLKGAGARDLHMLCIVAAPEGLSRLQERHPDVIVYTPAVDQELNAHKFIVPGLGDFGDRLYGT